MLILCVTFEEVLVPYYLYLYVCMTDTFTNHILTVLNNKLKHQNVNEKLTQ